MFTGRGKQVTVFVTESDRERPEIRVEVEAEKRVGHPAHTLVHCVRDTGVELLVMGHTGHSKLWRTFLGTTAAKVVRHAPCSVRVVR